MQVKIVNGLHAYFKQPSGPSRAGHEWMVLISTEGGERQLLARTYDDDAPQAKPEQHAQRALSYVVHLLNSGSLPPDEPGQSAGVVVPK